MHFKSTIALLAFAGLGSLSSASPIAKRTASVNASQPFNLQYVVRSVSDTNPANASSAPGQDVGIFQMFEPVVGIPYDAVRWMQPSDSKDEATPVTLLGGYFHVSASAVPVPGGNSSSPNYGWTADNEPAFETGGAGPVQFKAQNYGADGDLYMDPGTNAIRLGDDYTEFWICNKTDGGNGEYLSFGQDPKSTSACKPVFLYGAALGST